MALPVSVSPSMVALHLTFSFIGLVMACCQLTSLPFTVTSVSADFSPESVLSAVPDQVPSAARSKTRMAVCLPRGVSIIMFQVPAADMLRSPSRVYGCV